MVQTKRKRSNGEDDEARPAAAQPEKTRRVTRQTSIPPPMPHTDAKEVAAPRRTLRGSSSAAVDVDVDVSADLATVRRSQVRTRRASKLSDSAGDVAVEDNEDNEDDGEEMNDGKEKAADKVRTTRSKAKARSEEVELGEKKAAQPEQQRRLRGGKTVPEAEPISKSKPRAGKTVSTSATATAKRRTRQAAKDMEIADSDEAGGDDDADDADDSKSIPDSDERTGDRSDDDSSEASPIHTRRPRKANVVQAPAPVVSPLTPPHAAAPTASDATAAAQPRKETTIKPPAVPSVAALQPPAARPKKVTEIKPPAAPPAPRYPVKTTPIQPPVLAALAAASSAASTNTKANTSTPRSQQFAKTTTVTPITAPRPSPMAAARPAPTPTTTPTTTTTTAASKTAPPTSPGQPDRNIDKVVLGEICFKAWYPSYYGKEVLGDSAGNTHHGRGAHAGKGHPGKENAHGHSSHGAHGAHKDKDSTPILDRLYVCPFCFKYSREIVPWHGHVQVCESQFQIPGDKVYVHPRGVRTIRVPIASSASARGSKRRKSGAGVGGVSGAGGAGGGSGGSPTSGAGTASAGGGSASAAADQHEYIEQVVKDEGEWSIWEVDGERDVLFCQNISLFAKLFLDTKSVFFDVTGFKYFLLVYTPPPSLPSSLRAAATATLSPMSGGAGGSGNGNGAGQPPASILGGATPRPRVVGFFSKEKMSWDNNNLACILVFPPWQRKGLGALLMGLSYEISRREGVLGGPEKPISDLGKKGYKRFWAGEIARWLLGVDIPAALGVSAGVGGGGGGADGLPPTSPVDELVINIDDISDATWIVRDDCLYVLREMGIVEDAGMGAPKKFCENVLPRADMASAEAVGTEGDAASADADAPAGTAPAVAAPTSAAAADSEPPPEVKRVRLSKAAVRQWIKDNHISLDRACDAAGFIKDYSRKDAPEEA